MLIRLYDSDAKGAQLGVGWRSGRLYSRISLLQRTRKSGKSKSTNICGSAARANHAVQSIGIQWRTAYGPPTGTESRITRRLSTPTVYLVVFQRFFTSTFILHHVSQNGKVNSSKSSSGREYFTVFEGYMTRIQIGQLFVHVGG